MLAFEMKCYRRIMRIRWEQKITNEDVRRRVRCRKNIVQQIMEWKLNLFGHICRMKDNRLMKEVIFGTMKGKSGRGRPCREWLDDVKEWGGEEIHILHRKAQHWTPTGAEPKEHWMDGFCFVYYTCS